MTNSNYKPYKALEFHLSNSIELHDAGNPSAMKQSEAEYQAAMLAQQVQMDDEQLLEEYREFCKENDLEAHI